jgi:5'-nucleotidase
VARRPGALDVTGSARTHGAGAKGDRGAGWRRSPGRASIDAVRIQVTNDDGIQSEGLQVLTAHLAAAGHEVVVVAPDRDWSGAGAAFGSFRPDQHLDVQRVTIDACPDVEAWALDGPPALTVIAARLGAFGEAPDLVVSGINAGLNTGRAILHSGTVGAALTAQNFGISGLAVSVDQSDPWCWDTAAQLAVEVLPLVVDAPPRSVLNLNVPARASRQDVEGIRWTGLAPFGAVRAAVVGRDDTRLQFELQVTGYEPPVDTDQGAVQVGYAALTTLVGVVEAWPAEEGIVGTEPADLGAEIEERLAPGANLHAVHRLPDASHPLALRRPLLGDAEPFGPPAGDGAS